MFSNDKHAKKLIKRNQAKFQEFQEEFQDTTTKNFKLDIVTKILNEQH